MRGGGVKPRLRVLEAMPTTERDELAYHIHVPERAVREGAASVVVAVHGIARDAREQLTRFAAFAEERGHVLVAPRFDTARDGDYQRLGRRGRGRRADLALDHALARIAEETGIRFRRRHLFGFSGGGQFVHRYLMSRPDGVDAAVVAAAGWYTFPDARSPYPYGLRTDGALAGVRMDPAAFLRVPVLVVVGRLDVERDESIRTSEAIDQRQGRTRIERAQRWVAAMRAAARARGIGSRHELLLLERAGHSFADCVDAGLARATFDFFDAVERAATDADGSNAHAG